MESMKRTEGDEITLRELIVILLKEKWMILTSIVVCLIVAFGVSYHLSSQNQSAQVIVGFEFSGIEVHKNPDGTKFDPYQMAAPYILGEVIEALSLDTIRPNDLRNLIDMSAVIPEDIMTIRSHRLENEGETFQFYPNEYILQVHANPSIGVDGQLAQAIAYEMIKVYTTYFQDTYIQREPVTNKLKQLDMSLYDYSDVSGVLRGQAEALLDYTETMMAIDDGFRSIRTGMSFNDLYQVVAMIDEVDLNRTDAIISSYKLTKDRSRLIIYYEYLLKELNQQKNIHGDHVTVSKDMLLNMEDTNSGIVMNITGEDNEGQSYFNQLILETFDSETQALAIQEQINYYEQEVQELRSDTYQTNNNRDEVIGDLEVSMSRVKEDLNYWIDMTDATVGEYYDNHYADMILELSPVTIVNPTNTLLNLAIGMVLGGMIGVFGAFAKAYWQQGSEGGMVYEV